MKKTKVFIMDYCEEFLEEIERDLKEDESIEVVGTLKDGANIYETLDNLYS